MDGPIDSASLDKEAKPARKPRRSVFLAASILHRDGGSSNHRVRDVSDGGVRVDNAETLIAGQAITIALGSAPPVEAKVVWVRAGLAGIAFQTSAQAVSRSFPATAPRPAAEVAQPASTIRAPTAGWLEQRKNPYRR